MFDARGHAKMLVMEDPLPVVGMLNATVCLLLLPPPRPPPLLLPQKPWQPCWRCTACSKIGEKRDVSLQMRRQRRMMCAEHPRSRETVPLLPPDVPKPGAPTPGGVTMTTVDCRPLSLQIHHLRSREKVPLLLPDVLKPGAPSPGGVTKTTVDCRPLSLLIHPKWRMKRPETVPLLPLGVPSSSLERLLAVPNAGSDHSEPERELRGPWRIQPDATSYESAGRSVSFVSD